MGVDFFREETNWEQAQIDVSDWGFPRPVDSLEAEAATWVRFGQSLLVWFLQGPETDSLSVHICAAPDARGNVGTPRQMIALEVVGEMLGATRLWSLTGAEGEDPRLPREYMRNFLVARGWTNADRGTFIDLGVH
jgi:hypothetical protein